MHRNTKLIIGLALLLLGLFILMFYIGSDQHHEKMTPHKTELQSSTGILNDDSPGAQQFQKACTTCHGLPYPKQYTANEWLLVIARMQQHTIKAGETPPDAKTTAAITEFLQRNARPAM